MSEYLIHGETMSGLADEVRRLSGQEGLMTPSQMKAALQGVTAGIEIGDEVMDEIHYYYWDNNDGVIIFSPPMDSEIVSYVISSYQQNMKSISLPAADNIGGMMFQSYTTLTEANFPTCITIGENAFSECGNLAVINAPACTEIDYNAFYNCDSLTSVYMPACTTVGPGVFVSCDSLTSVYMPACTFVGSEAFEDCSSLTEVTLNSLCGINDHAFNGVLDPDNKVVKIYLIGDTMGFCNSNAFGDISNSSGGSGSGSGSESGDGEESTEPIPGLEIYVPANLVDEFKSSWAGGAFANNIFALPET